MHAEPDAVLPPAPLTACIAGVKSIPAECQPYVLLTAIMGVLFITALIRTWLLRRVEAKLLKNKDALENQIVQQQKDLMATRQDANAWRAEMQRQFDHFRHLTNDQLKVEEKRFDDLWQKSLEREHALQTSLDIARQMCAELPTAKARLIQLESVLGLDAGEGLTAPNQTFVTQSLSIAPLPDLNGTEPVVPASPEAPTEEPDLNQKLSQLQQQNTQLQQALTAARLRSRIRERSAPARARGGKN